MAIFIHLPYSPWSMRARWALDHHKVSYKPVEHIPMVFEPFLRLSRAVLRPGGAAGALPKGKVTVPIFIDGPRIWDDSFAIATHAEEVGHGSTLVPRGSEREIRGWIDTADEMLAAGRLRVLERLAADRPALVESLPPPLRPLGPTLSPVARSAVQFVHNKYKSTKPEDSPPALEARMDAVLERIERHLEGRDYLLGNFSFADVTVATAIEMVAPSERTVLGPENKRVWTEERLAAAHPKALAFRDRVYAEHRPS